MADRATTAEAVSRGRARLLFSSHFEIAFAFGSNAAEGRTRAWPSVLTPARLHSFASIIGGAILLRVSAV